MDEVDCSELLSFAYALDKLAGPARAARVVPLAGDCFKEVDTALASVQQQLEKGVVPSAACYTKVGTIVTALAAVASGTEPVANRSTMRRLEDISGAKLFRRELWREATRTLVELERGSFATVRREAWTLRNRHRAVGRPVDYRSVSRTLRIKGLELDHALVLSADEFEDTRKPGDGARHF